MSATIEGETVICHICGDIMQRAGQLLRLPQLRHHQRLLVTLGAEKQLSLG